MVAIEATAHRFAQRATERNEFREREANNRLKWQARGGGRGMRSTQRVMPKAVALIFIVILGIVILL